MKLRRSLAVAAATAVIAPTAFLAAPAAFAADGAQDTTVNEPQPPAAPDAQTPESPDQDPSEPGTAPEGQDPSATASEPDADTPEPPETPENPEPSAPESETTPETPAPSPSAAEPTDPGASPSASPGDGPEGCLDGEEVKEDTNLKTTFSGLPERVVAGSGFHAFTLDVANKGNTDYRRVDLGVFAAQVDGDTFEDRTDHLTLQYKDPESGTWKDISVDAEDDEQGYLGYTDVKAKTTYSVDLRMSVDKSAPDGIGYAFGIGLYADDEGDCVVGDYEVYLFDVLAAGKDAGDPNEATPQGGKKPLPAKPAGNTEIKPTGTLAETGSSSVLPVVGMAGGIAIVAGAGVMFAVKRRRSGAAA
ncbi:hypothetical protein [Streptomyces sp. NPDC095613]|uniref:hypothetical protein n=1 Tax=Streptomyces sp. NPDC095613 TaxID=3155540 RepID=UPI00332D39B5